MFLVEALKKSKNLFGVGLVKTDPIVYNRNAMIVEGFLVKNPNYLLSPGFFIFDYNLGSFMETGVFNGVGKEVIEKLFHLEGDGL